MNLKAFLFIVAAAATASVVIRLAIANSPNVAHTAGLTPGAA